ncbi:hypothetical protein ACGF5S_17305 [Nocardia nova]|uniref:hypothetical protein n=1 Tax=Nocardia nova TaxID=37330 RepID=UPI00371357DE
MTILARSGDIRTFLAYPESTPGPRDPQMRVAEYLDVAAAIAANEGRTFTTEADATEALFDEYGGGGFGICAELQHIVLNLFRDRALHPQGRSHRTTVTAQRSST